MIVFRTWKDGHSVRPDLFLSARAARLVGDRLSDAAAVRALPSFDKLQFPVCDHPDMLVFERSGTIITYEGYFSENRDLFSSLNIKVRCIPDPIDQIYPHDIALNYLSIGRYIIGRVDLADPMITDGMTPIMSRQGYARCSVCMVGEAAAITADSSMAKALTSIGVDVLNITPAHIVLDGYDCGFIGGASFCIDRTIYFFGSLSTHPDGERIRHFIAAHGYNICELLQGKLHDFGG